MNTVGPTQIAIVLATLGALFVVTHALKRWIWRMVWIVGITAVGAGGYTTPHLRLLDHVTGCCSAYTQTSGAHTK